MPDMEQRPRNVAVKDVRIRLRREECVKVMERSGQYVVVKVVQVRLSKEECVSGMEQRLGSNEKLEYSSERKRHEGFKVCDADKGWIYKSISQQGGAELLQKCRMCTKAWDTG